MPANRSRTMRWREMLEQIAQRGGAVELSIHHAGSDAAPQSQQESSDEGAEAQTTHDAPTDLVWRVRLRDVTDDGLVVEAPSAAGLSLSMDAGVAVVGAMTVGQNRWMFHSTVAQQERIEGRQHLRLTPPERVERCQRRTYNRMSTASRPGRLCQYVSVRRSRPVLQL